MRITPLGTWLACRFLEEGGIAAAAAHFNGHYQHVNPHSGKFNYHPEGEDAAECIRHIESVPRAPRS